MYSWIPEAAGFAVAVVVGHFCVDSVVSRLWKVTHADESTAGEPGAAIRLPQLVGVLERSLYVGVLLMGAREMIAVWLALKVAGTWGKWSEDKKDDATGKFIPGRAIYNIFLVGNAMSLGAAMLGFLTIGFLETRKWGYAGAMPVILIAASLLILWIITRPKFSEEPSAPVPATDTTANPADPPA